MSGLEPVLIGTAIAGSLASTGLSAYGTKMKAEEESRSAAFEADQLRIQAEQQKTAAAQDEARRRNELTSNLETIAALRAGRGVGSQSPTGMAIFDSAIEDAERDISIERANLMTRADLSRRAGEQATRRARTSLLAGQVGAYGELAGGLTKAATLARGYSSKAA